MLNMGLLNMGLLNTLKSNAWYETEKAFLNIWKCMKF